MCWCRVELGWYVVLRVEEGASKDWMDNVLIRQGGAWYVVRIVRIRTAPVSFHSLSFSFFFLGGGAGASGAVATTLIVSHCGGRVGKRPGWCLEKNVDGGCGTWQPWQPADKDMSRIPFIDKSGMCS